VKGVVVEPPSEVVPGARVVVVVDRLVEVLELTLCPDGAAYNT
jgi:hypothetical protein